jgi:hypothetical protein
MPRFKLRTLLILLAILPPLLWVGWTKHQAWKADEERQEQVRAAFEWVRQHQTSPPWFIPAEPFIPADQ